MTRTLASIALTVALGCNPQISNAQTPPPALQVRSPQSAEVLREGAAAPRFTATTHDGRRVSSDGARPRVLVVYFYPRDETPGCTREAHGFRDLRAQLDAAGADVVGVSTDSASSHASFAQGHSLNFGLIADPEGALARAFGLRVMGFAPRTTFIIGRDGRVARVFEQVRVDGHAEAVLAAVRALGR